MSRAAPAILLVLLVSATAFAQRTHPPEMPDFESEVYKTVNGVDLKIYQIDPVQKFMPRPAIVFFFGGGWRNGSPKQFEHQAKYLASRGMIAFIADYRVSSRHQVTADECVKDAKSAVRWIRANAKRLGVNPDMIVASGGSAGGHLAACTGVIPGFEDDHESVSSVPNAMILFNPAVVLAPYDGVPIPGERIESLLQRMGVPIESISPIHHVRAGQPPAIIFHGDADSTVPHHTVKRFTEVMNAAGNTCELMTYEGEGHGFFNSNRNDGQTFRSTMRQADAFLVKHGLLFRTATIDNYEQ